MEHYVLDFDDAFEAAERLQFDNNRKIASVGRILKFLVVKLKTLDEKEKTNA